MLIHRFEAELIFANADLFQDDLLARIRAAEPPPDTVVLDFEAVSQVDVTGAQTLRSVHDTLEALGIRLIVARAKSTVRDALRRNGIVDVLGEDNLAPTVDGALEAIQATHDTRPLKPHRRLETLVSPARSPSEQERASRRCSFRPRSRLSHSLNAPLAPALDDRR